MIYTVTLNPAVDYFMEIGGELMSEEVNRGRNEIFKAAGKGLNVSRDLSIMNIRSRALAVLGGFTGAFIEEEFSAFRAIELIRIPISGNNRVNVKLHRNGELIAVNGEGPFADETVRENVMRALSGTTFRDTCVISGSLMRGFDEEFVIGLCRQLHEKGTSVVLDMEKLSLSALQACRPDLIKPNLYELGLLLSLSEEEKEDPVRCLAKAYDMGLKNILLSMGKHGALLMLDGRKYRMSHPDTELVNRVGAGDAMLAAYIGKRSEGVSPEDALRWAGAMANAVGSTMDDATMDDVMMLFDNMTVTSVNE